MDGEAVFFGYTTALFSQGYVTDDSTAQENHARGIEINRPAEALHQVFENGGLERGGKILDELASELGLIPLQILASSRLETRETKVEILAGSHGLGQMIFVSAAGSQIGEDGSAGIAEEEEASHFVIGLTGRVV